MSSKKRFFKRVALLVVLPLALGAGAAWASEQSILDGKKSTTSGSPAPVVTSSATPKSIGGPKASVKPGRQYEVQPGDTISTIASANGIDWQELAKYNNVPYPYNLTVGQVIAIPERQ